MNAIEEKWLKERPSGEFWTPADQVVVAIALDSKVITQSDTFEVKLKLILHHTASMLSRKKHS